MNGENVLGTRRRELALLLARQLDARIAGRIRLNPVVVEDHRQHGDSFPDRLLAQAGAGEVGDELGDVVRLELGRG